RASPSMSTSAPTGTPTTPSTSPRPTNRVAGRLTARVVVAPGEHAVIQSLPSPALTPQRQLQQHPQGNRATCARSTPDGRLPARDPRDDGESGEWPPEVRAKEHAENAAASAEGRGQVVERSVRCVRSRDRDPARHPPALGSRQRRGRQDL